MHNFTHSSHSNFAQTQCVAYQIRTNFPLIRLRLDFYIWMNLMINDVCDLGGLDWPMHRFPIIFLLAKLCCKVRL